MRSIVFSEQFYYPEGWGGAQLPRDLTIFLARNDVRVTVVCGADQYAPVEENEQLEDPRTAGVVIKRIPRLLGGSIHQRKVLKQLLFYVGCWPLLLWRRSPDLFVTQTNPPLLVPMVALTALLRRRPFVIIAQDIYPEVMFAHGMSRRDSVVGRLLTRVFAWAYRRAEKVVALGNVMSDRLVEKGVSTKHVAVISNWATGDESVIRGAQNRLLAEWSLAGCFVILYSGNVGIAHDCETPIAMLSHLLAHAADFRLVFIGKGSTLASAQQAAVAAGVSHAVQFRPLVPAAMLPESLGIADLALVTLREGFEGLVVPSKLLGYMARGIPTLYFGPHSDIEQMLIDSGSGVCFRNGDATGAGRELLALRDSPERLAAMGASATHYYNEHLSRPHGLRKYASLFDSIISRSVESHGVTGKSSDYGS